MASCSGQSIHTISDKAKTNPFYAFPRGYRCGAQKTVLVATAPLACSPAWSPEFRMTYRSNNANCNNDWTDFRWNLSLNHHLLGA